MSLLLAAVLILFLSGILAMLARRQPHATALAGAGGVVVAGLLGLAAVARQFFNPEPDRMTLGWSMPCGEMTFQLDSLAAFFLLPILVLSGLAAVFGVGYLAHQTGKRSLGTHWFFFNLLVASMIMVCVARHVLAFLLFWELMTLASFFLVAFDSEKKESRKAAFTYLIATHIGTAFLFPMFLLLGHEAGSLDFGVMASTPVSPETAGLCFIFAVVGFGAKAGFIPFHVWLPEAHPAAPSHVSALMSGVMIKTGIYGLLRVLTLLGPPPFWWGSTLIAIGAVSGVMGVLFAIAQHDLKRLLAYHSVENIGIIALGIGTGLLGLSAGNKTVAVLGFAGGLLHVLNHALFKGLLFLGAGSVLHATGTREIDHLGGLLKRMPTTGGTFLIGAAAISGLPPLNGFVSEFLIYFAMFSGVISLSAANAIPLLCGILALVLIGGLAAACFAKAFGIVFLGEPRTAAAERAHETSPLMTWPMACLAAACVILGLAGPLALSAMNPVLSQFAGPDTATVVADAAAILTRITIGGGMFFILLALLTGVRYGLLRRCQTSHSATWGCGYTAPSTRMQYTASSFAQPITKFLSQLLRTKSHIQFPSSYFPDSARHETETPDVWHEEFYRPLFQVVGQFLSRFKVIQAGSIHAYVLYLVLTLLALLLWKL